MKIATIVGSNSHIDYVARVVEQDAGTGLPRPDDHGFGRFVSMDADTDHFVGIIYDSRLINPDFTGSGPRLDPRPALDDFDPREKGKTGILIGIIVLGRLLADGSGDHSVPARTLTVGQEVSLLSPESIRSFHTNADGEPDISYFDLIMGRSGQLAVPLIGAVVSQISAGFDDNAKERLKILLNAVKWQRTMAEAKF